MNYFRLVPLLGSLFAASRDFSRVAKEHREVLHKLVDILAEDEASTKEDAAQFVQVLRDGMTDEERHWFDQATGRTDGN